VIPGCEGEFPVQKRGVFCHGKEVEAGRGGVHRYAAQGRPKTDAARAGKNRFGAEAQGGARGCW